MIEILCCTWQHWCNVQPAVDVCSQQ